MNQPIWLFMVDAAHYRQFIYIHYTLSLYIARETFATHSLTRILGVQFRMNHLYSWLLDKLAPPRNEMKWSNTSLYACMPKLAREWVCVLNSVYVWMSQIFGTKFFKAFPKIYTNTHAIGSSNKLGFIWQYWKPDFSWFRSYDSVNFNCAICMNWMCLKRLYATQYAHKSILSVVHTQYFILTAINYWYT